MAEKMMNAVKCFGGPDAAALSTPDIIAWSNFDQVAYAGVNRPDLLQRKVITRTKRCQ